LQDLTVLGILQSADKNFILPMSGFTGSFNVAAAVAITVANLNNKMLLTPNLTENEQNDILFEWLVNNVHHSHELLKAASINIDDL
jgi:hypothetical protein